MNNFNNNLHSNPNSPPPNESTDPKKPKNYHSNINYKNNECGGIINKNDTLEYPPFYFDNCIFDNTQSFSYFESDNQYNSKLVSVNNCIFNNIQSIYFKVYTYHFIIENSIFSNNINSILYGDGDNIIINKCIFTNNKIINQKESILLFNNNNDEKIKNNYRINININNSLFFNNSITRLLVSGVRNKIVLSQFKLSLTNCTIKNNYINSLKDNTNYFFSLGFLKENWEVTFSDSILEGNNLNNNTNVGFISVNKESNSGTIIMNHVNITKNNLYPFIFTNNSIIKIMNSNIENLKGILKGNLNGYNTEILINNNDINIYNINNNKDRSKSKNKIIIIFTVLPITIIFFFLLLVFRKKTISIIKKIQYKYSNLNGPNYNINNNIEMNSQFGQGDDLTVKSDSSVKKLNDNESAVYDSN
ncbi:hypothetical protein DICPUDRAFT_97000 [Dictyostelium purpureum]|uniref:Right handed beta helix domain-containing protein n=1 Tax=Dictyostelium purpureum TaxID=5786 RepID=F0ZD41_DICPU|nr:uncharacterized protein DICPUDRAFT_97000 [Dictyostelium purpureum]EGC38135.1 hypothetical protein DICPUDRAFT_97000 [Dictyostelium purpureum]|eukprot:XP_003285349.1 hypothetical protein DICPUDRAFT_97000 [Dictyostelium purpureum]